MHHTMHVLAASDYIPASDWHSARVIVIYMYSTTFYLTDRLND